jgi:MFS family permease
VFGRRHVYVVSYAFFAAWSWASAYAPNYGAFVTFRFLAGVSGSSSLNNHPASISDFTTAAQRNRYSAAYACLAFEGAAVAPMLGGFIVNRAGWRWQLIIAAIIASVAFALIVVGVDESYAPILLYRKHGQLPNTVRLSLISRLKTALVQPFKLLFTEPILALVCLYISILYGLFYGFFAGE